jgi:phospholipid/cholesterol/gamma-HCH transport system substrate-binding protein
MTAGILGDRYVSLQLGGEVDLLEPGDEITFSESAVLLERVIGKLVHNANVEGEE